ncbi:MAG: hypothetical protein WB949_00760 [Candidatus Acidiferrales bacterium]
MKTLFLKHDYGQAAAKLLGQFAAPSHVDLTLDKDTRLIAPGGRIFAVLLRDVIPPELYKLAYELWKPVNGNVSNRITAVGTKSLPRSKNKKGKPSPRSGVNIDVLKLLEARQGIIGYLDRPCRRTTLTKRRPEMLNGSKRLTKLLDQLYARYLPTFYSIQRAEVEKVGPAWCLWATAFTTIYIAKNFRTAYHRDRGNLLGVMTALMPMGKFTGGELVLPRWRIAIAFKPGDLLLFDPQEVHGNLPFEGERLSAAFYCARHIADCGK